MKTKKSIPRIIPPKPGINVVVQNTPLPVDVPNPLPVIVTNPVNYWPVWTYRIVELNNDKMEVFSMMQDMSANGWELVPMIMPSPYSGAYLWRKPNDPDAAKRL